MRDKNVGERVDADACVRLADASDRPRGSPLQELRLHQQIDHMRADGGIDVPQARRLRPGQTQTGHFEKLAANPIEQGMKLIWGHNAGQSSKSCASRRTRRNRPNLPGNRSIAPLWKRFGQTYL